MVCRFKTGGEKGVVKVRGFEDKKQWKSWEKWGFHSSSGWISHAQNSGRKYEQI